MSIIVSWTALLFKYIVLYTNRDRDAPISILKIKKNYSCTIWFWNFISQILGWSSQCIPRCSCHVTFPFMSLTTSPLAVLIIFWDQLNTNLLWCCTNREMAREWLRDTDVNKKICNIFGSVYINHLLNSKNKRN